MVITTNKKVGIIADSFIGTPGAIRTHDLQYRKLTLYPAELRVHKTGVIVS
jgi:hypothetical protein